MLHKSQVFFYLLAAFISGVFLASVFGFSHIFVYIIFIVAVGLVALGGFKNNAVLFGVFILVALIIGIVRFNQVNFKQDAIERFVGQEITLKGYVSNEPVFNENIQRFAFNPKTVSYKSSENTLYPLDLFPYNNSTAISWILAFRRSFLWAVRKPAHRISSAKDSDFVKIAKDIPPQSSSFSLKTMKFRNESYMGTGLIHDRVLDTTLILVTVGAYPRYKYGDFVEITGKLELPENFSDSDFDYIAYLKKDGIRTVLFFPTIEFYNNELGLRFLERLEMNVYKKIFSMKAIFESSVNNSVSEPNAAFINGILLGTRQNIPDDLKDAFSKTGTTHILAISGYNIMIISWGVLNGLIFFFRRRTAFWISVGAIIVFVILTGASASVVRAAIMGLLLSFAHGYGRLYDPKNSIILAGAVMIYHNPMLLVFDIGFQLSFVAVLGLMYLYPYLDSKLYKVPKLGTFKENALITISAQIAVAPLIIYYFKNLSIVSVPTNVLILPFIPVAMLTGFLAGLSGIVWPIFGEIVGYAAWAITTYQIEVVRFFGIFV